MRARFVSQDPTENPVCDYRGYAFPLGEWVTVDRETWEKVAKMPPFEVDGDNDGDSDPDVDAMRAALTARGVKFHHKAGPEKLAALLADTEEKPGE